jgi:hypothetical protein
MAKLSVQITGKESVYVGLASTGLCAGMSASGRKELLDLHRSLVLGIADVEGLLLPVLEQKP